MWDFSNDFLLTCRHHVSFAFQGEVYHTCTDVDSEVLWCATKVDGDGVAVDHFWGECDMATCTSDGA